VRFRSAFGRFLSVVKNHSFKISPTGRVVGGEPTDIEKHPYLVSIQLKSENGFSKHICGGTIYNQLNILTACHCFYDSSGNTLSSLSFRVIVGATDLREPNIPYTDINGYILNPNYTQNPNPISSVGDIAIVRLSTPLRYGSNVQPLPLSSEFSTRTRGIGLSMIESICL